MEHIGHRIRKKRREKRLSAEYIASRLKKPISKQAFAKKERNGSFSYDLVMEVACIIGCAEADFLIKKSTDSLRNDITDPDPAA